MHLSWATEERDPAQSVPGSCDCLAMNGLHDSYVRPIQFCRVIQPPMIELPVSPTLCHNPKFGKKVTCLSHAMPLKYHNSKFGTHLTFYIKLKLKKECFYKIIKDCNLKKKQEKKKKLGWSQRLDILHIHSLSKRYGFYFRVWIPIGFDKILQKVQDYRSFSGVGGGDVHPLAHLILPDLGFTLPYFITVPACIPGV